MFSGGRLSRCIRSDKSQSEIEPWVDCLIAVGRGEEGAELEGKWLPSLPSEDRFVKASCSLDLLPREAVLGQRTVQAGKGSCYFI